MASRGQPRRRARPRRQPMRRILVVTEGTRTEPQYVEGLNHYLRDGGATAVVKSVAVGKDPLKVVQKCMEKRDSEEGRGKDFDDCVCLVDVDQHETLPAARKLAERESILLLISNLKFEVWLRWHVEDKRSALTSAQLDDFTAKLGLVRGKFLSPSFPFHAVQAACGVARAADPGAPGRACGSEPFFSDACPRGADAGEMTLWSGGSSPYDVPCVGSLGGDALFERHPLIRSLARCFRGSALRLVLRRWASHLKAARERVPAPAPQWGWRFGGDPTRVRPGLRQTGDVTALSA